MNLRALRFLRNPEDDATISISPRSKPPGTYARTTRRASRPSIPLRAISAYSASPRLNARLKSGARRP
jgi:hypothetical protein